MSNAAMVDPRRPWALLIAAPTLRAPTDQVTALERAFDAPTASHVVERLADVHHAVLTLLSAHPDVLAVAGSDTAFAHVARTLLSADARRHPLPALLHLGGGAARGVSNALHLHGTPTQRLQRARALDYDERADALRAVPTLRVSSSLQPRPDFGFQLGLGLLYELAEATARRGDRWHHHLLVAAQQLFTEAQHGWRPSDLDAGIHIDARIDDQPTTEPTRLAWATALPQRGMTGPRNTFDAALTSRGLTALLARQLPAVMQPSFTAPVQRVRELVFDLNTGYVLDGELFPAQTPYALAITAGPPINVLVV